MLHKAAKLERMDVISIILNQGKCINLDVQNEGMSSSCGCRTDTLSVSSDGDTALHIVCCKNQPEIVALLLSKGASPSVANKL